MTAPTRHLLIAVSLFLNTAAMAQTERWSEKAANDWYRKQPWLVGSNYIPATAINQLEMWQADTFDPARINLEMTWAEDLGMNTSGCSSTIWRGSRTPEASSGASIGF